MKSNSTDQLHQNGKNNDAVAAQSAGGPIVVLSDDTFVEQVLHSDVPVLVDFKAEWCGPCKFMGPIFAQLAPEYEGKVKFAKLDVDENPGVAGALRVESIPTFLLFYRNTVLNSGVGAMRPPDLRQWIEEGLSRASSIPEQSQTAS